MQIAIANLVGFDVSLADLVIDVAAISLNMARTRTIQHLDFDEPMYVAKLEKVAIMDLTGFMPPPLTNRTDLNRDLGNRRWSRDILLGNETC